VNGLEDTFEGQVEFVILDFDDSSLNDQRQALGITGRTQYVLADGNGNVLTRWYGLLSESTVASEIEAIIAG